MTFVSVIASEATQSPFRSQRIDLFRIVKESLLFRLLQSTSQLTINAKEIP